MDAREEFFRWLDDTRATFGSLGVSAVNPETLLTEIASRVRAVLAAGDEELLTLAQAASRSGYSIDHLGRLIRKEVIPNAGAPNRPRVRAADLSRLGQHRRRGIATPQQGAYDPIADARALLGRRGGKRG